MTSEASEGGNKVDLSKDKENITNFLNPEYIFSQNLKKYAAVGLGVIAVTAIISQIPKAIEVIKSLP